MARWYAFFCLLSASPGDSFNWSPFLTPCLLFIASSRIAWSYVQLSKVLGVSSCSSVERCLAWLRVARRGVMENYAGAVALFRELYVVVCCFSACVFVWMLVVGSSASLRLREECVTVTLVPFELPAAGLGKRQV